MHIIPEVSPSMQWPLPDVSKSSFACNQYKTTCPVTLGSNLGVTEKAMNALQTLKTMGYQVYHIEEMRFHDGYDRYGPESDIWRLSIHTYKLPMHPVCYTFSWENWFAPGDKAEPYSLFEITPVK